MNTPANPFSWVNPEDPSFQENLRLHSLSGSRDWAQLTKPNIVRQVHAALANIKRAYETELSDLSVERSIKQAQCWAKGPRGKSEWFAYELDYKVRRRDLVRQKQAIDTAISAVKPHLISANIQASADASVKYVAARPSGTSEETAMLGKLLFDLVGAVLDHKQSIERSANVPTVSDRALWSALARLRYPTRDGDLSLREWFARATR